MILGLEDGKIAGYMLAETRFAQEVTTTDEGLTSDEDADPLSRSVDYTPVKLTSLILAAPFLAYGTYWVFEESNTTLAIRHFIERSIPSFLNSIS